MSQTRSLVAVLDDEPQMRKALRRLLAAHGFRVADYHRGDEFLAALPSHPADCLVLDLHMPEVSGFEVLAAFAAQQIATPVVVITGHDEPGTMEQAIRLGASAYLTKPVDEMELLSAIQSALTCEPQHPNEPRKATPRIEQGNNHECPH
ncbi:MAG: response regulator [Verrucomicrobia bacterium]|nr:response regulator [Verrucomicrobiota bacterium]